MNIDQTTGLVKGWTPEGAFLFALVLILCGVIPALCVMFRKEV